ncbi:hypothetical protein N7465_007400 [Penicillium sp. CMV-2018d]|nr:hypothetical protein N7465_007400 [Penicillium sp. CMV-2018d]
MATELCKSDDLTIDTSKSRIGNPEGHALLSRLDSIANDIKDLQGRATRSERLLERSDRLLDSLLVVRHGVLDEWAGQPRVQDEVQERNGVAHGGCIIMDIEVILSMFQDEPERATRWEEAFLTHYGVSWQKVASSKNDLKAGSRMAKIFDIYADSKSLHRYQKGHNTQRKDEVVRLCEEWIAKWKSDPTIKITPEDFEHILALDRNVY